MDDEKIQKLKRDSNPYLSSNSSFLAMLAEIVQNDSKKAEGCVSVAPIAFWTQLFAKYFLHVNNPNHDDLLFYVWKDAKQHSEKSEVKVFRRESPRNPGLGDPAIDWTETVYLNLILQQLKYHLTCAICTKSDSGAVNIHHKVTQEVYASPSRHDMEEKGPTAELSYPNIFFSIDSFDEIWSDMHINEGEIVCVEIVAHDEKRDFNSVIFLGSVNYSSLNTAYSNKVEALGSANKFVSVMTLGLYRPTSSQVQFVKMRGPNGKGYAEMAVDLYKKGKSKDEGVKDSSVAQSSKLPSDEHETVRRYLTAMPSIGSTSSNATSQWRKPTTNSSLKTQLTYVTLPWHNIVLDLLRTYECPTECKKPVLG